MSVSATVSEAILEQQQASTQVHLQPTILLAPLLVALFGHCARIQAPTHRLHVSPGIGPARPFEFLRRLLNYDGWCVAGKPQSTQLLYYQVATTPTVRIHMLRRLACLVLIEQSPGLPFYVLNVNAQLWDFPMSPLCSCSCPMGRDGIICDVNGSDALLQLLLPSADPISHHHDPQNVCLMTGITARADFQSARKHAAEFRIAGSR